MDQDFTVVERCPYCDASLDRCTLFEDDGLDEEPPSKNRRVPGARVASRNVNKFQLTDADRSNLWSGLPDLAFLWSCPNCAYWQWQDIFENRGLHGSAATSVLTRFDPRVPDGCEAELSQYLRRNASLWHQLDPTGMERLVASLFRANYVDAEVMHVGRPADGGTDVVFVEANARRWLISVKRRERSDATEGVGTVRSLLGTLAAEGQLCGIVASNADHFSAQARRDVRRVNARGTYTLKLLDRGKLNRMLGGLLPDRPWQHYLHDRELPEVAVQWFLRHTTPH
jgi:hypothetical protein